METLTPQKRLEVYREMLDELIKDRQRSLSCNEQLFGLCGIVRRVNARYKIDYFPELMAIEPKKYVGAYWWPVSAKSTTRINKIRQIIEKMEYNQTKNQTHENKNF